jgi:hypothetical protein
MKTSKIVLLSILILFGIASTLIFLTLKNSKDCSQIVIDTYEIHSGIDIPGVVPINCYYDDVNQVRLSIYRLRGNLNTSKFTTMDFSDGMNLLHGKHLLSESETPIGETLLVAYGKKWGRTWTYIYDGKTSQLYAELKY